MRFIVSLAKSFGHAMLWFIPVYLGYKLYRVKHPRISYRDFIYYWSRYKEDEIHPNTKIAHGMMHGDKLIATRKEANIEDGSPSCKLEFYKNGQLFCTVFKHEELASNCFSLLKIVDNLILESVDRSNKGISIATYSINH